MARKGSAARRYAEAVFQLAERDNALDRWRDDLRTAADVTSDDRGARAHANSPMVPLAEREKLVTQLLGKRLSKPGIQPRPRARATRQSRAVGAHRRRVPAAAQPEARRRVGARHKRPAAHRRTRTRPSSPRRRPLTGTTVDVQTAVDPALIGGLTVRIGDRLIDASVRGRLERLREQLLAGARVGG